MEIIKKKDIIDFDEGWNLIQQGINEVKNILESENPEKPIFGVEEYMMVYTTITDLCTQKLPNDLSRKLYAKYRETFEEYLTSKVLPSLGNKHGEFLLREFVKSWLNNKIMIKWMNRLFQYLERYYIPRTRLPSLYEVGQNCFRELVYKELNEKVRDAAISMIDEERDGEQIDGALVKNVVDIFVVLGGEYLYNYEKDFEAAMLRDTAAYYSRKAYTWILEDSSTTGFLPKALESLKQEKGRVSHYLHPSTQTKLFEKIQLVLLTTYANAFQPPKQVTAGGMAMAEQAEDAARIKLGVLFAVSANES